MPKTAKMISLKNSIGSSLFFPALMKKTPVQCRRGDERVTPSLIQDTGGPPRQIQLNGDFTLFFNGHGNAFGL